MVFFVFGCRTRIVVLAIGDYSAGKGMYFPRSCYTTGISIFSLPLLPLYLKSSDRYWELRVVGNAR
jgi:hypothetical protein